MFNIERVLMESKIKVEEKEIVINGCVSLPEYVTVDAFVDSFINWIEYNGWSFGGGIYDYEDEAEL